MSSMWSALLGLTIVVATTAYAEQPMKASEEPFEFAELFPLREQIAEMAPLEPFRARDGASLSFRRYAAESKVHAILIHGSSAHSAYLHRFAKYLSGSGVANVYAPDLRGHGPNPQRRGDIDYVGQLEEDIADLIGHISAEAGEGARFIVGGHSSGGGLALRFAGSEYGHLANGILLLAPYLGHRAPMVKRNAGGWAAPDIPKIIGLSVLDGFGICRYNGAKVLRFNLPEKYRNGYETLEYSFRLMNGMHPADYRASLRNTESRLLVLVGTEDEAFHAAEFESGILPYKPDAGIAYVAGGSHLGIIMSEPAMAQAARWINEN
jgi:non-heme chloroperoxidase